MARPDLGETRFGATSDGRVCSDHFAPTQDTDQGKLLRALLMPDKAASDEDTCTEPPERTSLKRKPTYVGTKIQTKRPRLTNAPLITVAPIGSEMFISVHPLCRTQASSEPTTSQTDPLSLNTNIHDMESQCHGTVVKHEHGVRTVATQTFSRKALYLTVASITGAEQLDLPRILSEPPSNRSVTTQTTANLLHYFTNPVKKVLQSEIREVNKHIKMISDVPMDKNRFMQYCDTYLNEKIAKIVKTHSHIQEKFVGNRYGHDFKAFALNLNTSNPQSYKFVQKIFNLPSRTTLQRLQVPVRTGVNQNLIESLKVKVSKMTEKEKMCAVCFDVMSISNNLWYEVSNDFFCGMQEIDQVMGPGTARYAAILILKGLYTKWKQPISFAFMTEQKHYPELKEWLHKMIGIMFDIGLDIKAFVAALDNEFIDVSLASDAEHHFEIDGRKIYRFYDVRYLFKNARDALMECNFHVGTKVVQWKHVQKVYDKESDARHDNLSLMPKITANHVRPSEDDLNDVNLAIEVFSHSVAAAMNFHVITNMANKKMKDTVEFIDKMSKLFDILHCKTLSNAYRGTMQENQVLTEVLQYLQGLEVKTKHGNLMKSEFVTGLIVNIRSVVSLLEDLKKENLQYVLTRSLGKDCAEDFFEQCRRLGGNCCERPTAIMFARSFRRLFLVNLVTGLKNGENEQDLKTTLYKIGDYDLGKKDEPDIENLKLAGISDYKIQWPSIEYMTGYLIWKCLEKHKCEKFIEYLSSRYEIPAEGAAETLLENFKKYNAGNTDGSHLLEPPEVLVAFVEQMDLKYSEYFVGPNREPVNFGWNMYKYIETDTFELPCECFPLKFMKVLFIRMKIEHCVRDHNRYSKNPRKPRTQQAKKQSGRKGK